MCRWRADLESKESRIDMSVCRAVCWMMNRCDNGDGKGESRLGSKAIIYL